MTNQSLLRFFWCGTVAAAFVALALNCHTQVGPAPRPAPPVGATKSKGKINAANTKGHPPPAVIQPNAPTITKIDPDRFLTSGGSTITITGTNFGKNPRVSLVSVQPAADGDAKPGDEQVQGTDNQADVCPSSSPLPVPYIFQDDTTIQVRAPAVSPKGIMHLFVCVSDSDPAEKGTKAECLFGRNNQCNLTFKDPEHCWFIPTMRGMCQGDATIRQKNINNYYGVGGTGNISFFDQIKSIYNQASSSSTISADLTSLNFSSGWQMTAGTNVQAGSSGSTTTVTSGAIPTLSANGAAQAAQNMIYGGNFTLRAVFPVVGAGIQTSLPGGIGGTMNFVLQEGTDIQNFKPGTSTNVNSPPLHTAAGMEGYLLANSINLAPGTDSSSNTFAGQIFIGGSYGYSYTSHDYARDYGFGSVHRGVGQASAGILIKNVAKISISRGFGPSQVYIDSTSGAKMKVNNFKSFSFGIAYQSTSSSAKSTTSPSTASTENAKQ